MCSTFLGATFIDIRLPFPPRCSDVTCDLHQTGAGASADKLVRLPGVDEEGNCELRQRRPSFVGMMTRSLSRVLTQVGGRGRSKWWYRSFGFSECF